MQKMMMTFGRGIGRNRERDVDEIPSPQPKTALGQQRLQTMYFFC